MLHHNDPFIKLLTNYMIINLNVFGSHGTRYLQQCVKGERLWLREEEGGNDGDLGGATRRKGGRRAVEERKEMGLVAGCSVGRGRGKGD